MSISAVESYFINTNISGRQQYQYQGQTATSSSTVDSYSINANISDSYFIIVNICDGQLLNQCQYIYISGRFINAIATSSMPIINSLQLLDQCQRHVDGFFISANVTGRQLCSTKPSGKQQRPTGCIKVLRNRFKALYLMCNALCKEYENVFSGKNCTFLLLPIIAHCAINNYLFYGKYTNIGLHKQIYT